MTEQWVEEAWAEETTVEAWIEEAIVGGVEVDPPNINLNQL